MEHYLIDTNAVCDYLSAAFPDNGMQLLDKVMDAGPKISVVTQIELLCWNTDSTTERNVQNFIEESVIFNINPDIIEHCVALRRSKKIKTPDAIIAATVLSCGLTLITNNEKDFAGIKGLKLVNPYKI